MFVAAAVATSVAYKMERLPPRQLGRALAALLLLGIGALVLKAFARVVQTDRANPYSKMTRAEAQLGRAVLAKQKAGAATRADYEALGQIMTKYAPEATVPALTVTEPAPSAPLDRSDHQIRGRTHADDRKPDRAIAWLCTAQSNPKIVAELAWEELLGTDREARRVQQRIAMSNQNCKHVPEEDIPRTFFIARSEHDDRKPFTKALPPLAMNGFWIFSDQLAATISTADLGGAKFLPIAALMADRETPLPGRYSILNFGAVKSAVLLDESTLPTGFSRAVPRASYGIADNGLVLSASALEGPDIWSDPGMSGGFFVSDRLAEALRRDGFFDWFDFRSCRIQTRQG